MTDYMVGQRVTGVFYGQTKTGIVARLGTSTIAKNRVIFVRWDGEKGAKWLFTDSIQPIDS